MKVEKRRSNAFETECKMKETSLLVDRYKYLDLYPCTAQELRAMDYQVEQDLSANRNLLTPAQANINNREQPAKGSVGVARPDVSHMVPYAPLPSSSIRASQIYGYPVPAAASDLLTNMPPPHCFHGPFVAVDKLVKIIAENCPQSFDLMLERMAASENMDVDQYMSSSDRGDRAKKRHLDEEEEEGPTRAVAPPAFDLYRMRQQRRHDTATI